MKENKISHRQLVKKEDAIAYLENMAKSMKSGKVVLERNGQFVSLTAPDVMNMEIAAKDKKDKNELLIEFSWRKEPFVPDIAALNISSDEPPEPVEEKEEASAEPAEAKKEAKEVNVEPDELKVVEKDTAKSNTRTLAKSK